MSASNTSTQRNLDTPAIYCLRMHPDLKEAIGVAADKQHVPMNEFIARILADALERPELAEIPRKSTGRYGRPRSGKQPA